jgi:hypothetical protein
VPKPIDNIVIVASGGNIDDDMLRRALDTADQA